LAAFQRLFRSGNGNRSEDRKHRDDNKKLNESERFMTLLG
jgi:hypothetical protein